MRSPSIDYFLVVARGGKLTVGNGLFIWRDSGFGSPIGDGGAWQRQSTMQFDLATLRVNGCVPPTIAPSVPVLRHPFG